MNTGSIQSGNYVQFVIQNFSLIEKITRVTKVLLNTSNDKITKSQRKKFIIEENKIITIDGNEKSSLLQDIVRKNLEILKETKISDMRQNYSFFIFKHILTPTSTQYKTFYENFHKEVTYEILSICDYNIYLDIGTLLYFIKEGSKYHLVSKKKKDKTDNTFKINGKKYKITKKYDILKDLENSVKDKTLSHDYKITVGGVPFKLQITNDKDRIQNVYLFHLCLDQDDKNPDDRQFDKLAVTTDIRNNKVVKDKGNYVLIHENGNVLKDHYNCNNTPQLGGRKKSKQLKKSRRKKKVLKEKKIISPKKRKMNAGTKLSKKKRIINKKKTIKGKSKKKKE